MNYISTRGNFENIPSAKAVKLGMVPRGGLFVPEKIPHISTKDLNKMSAYDYRQLAQEILSNYLTDFSREEIEECTNKAYNSHNFDTLEVAPLHKLNESTFILELWHGPTAAFKDIALQIMPHFLSKAKVKLGSKKETVILVATSGDTGKAALEGFKDVKGLKIIVFYPHQGVSKIQELQMTTTEGSNTYVVAVKGNFDDCQNAVKEIFADTAFNFYMNERGYELSSANSINWGRLAPQIVYYFWSYLQLFRKREIQSGEKINFCVPTGNFGNILAGYYAFLMGLPVGRFICASNENNILTDFINTGIYDKRREFKKTNSPSMDILISSNLERFLFEITGHDGKKINTWFKELQSKEYFTVDPFTLKKIQQSMTGDFALEEEVLSVIKEVYRKYNYLLDTHTAVGFKVFLQTGQRKPSPVKTVICSTANPYKFNSSVLEALKGKAYVSQKNEFEILEELKNITGLEIHQGLKDLNKKEIKHKGICEKQGLREAIKEILSI